MTIFLHNFITKSQCIFYNINYVLCSQFTKMVFNLSSTFHLFKKKHSHLIFCVVLRSFVNKNNIKSHNLDEIKYHVTFFVKFIDKIMKAFKCKMVNK